MNELLSEFIFSVRTKEGQEYEPSPFRGMVASFERHLKRESYPVSIISDQSFERCEKHSILNRNCLRNKERETSRMHLWGRSRGGNETSIRQRPSRYLQPGSNFKYPVVKKKQPPFWALKIKGVERYALGRRKVVLDAPRC